jgi:hypothetical protein
MKRSPRFHLQPAERGKRLARVEVALNRLGFVSASNSASKHVTQQYLGIQDALSWDVVWTWDYTNMNMFASLQPHNRINHLPGNAILCSKGRLWTTHVEAAKLHGKEHFSFVPEHFLIPNQLPALRAELDKRSKSSAAKGESQRGARGAKDKDADFGNRWIIKSRNHGGVHLMGSTLTPSTVETEKNAMVSEYIEPMLIGGHKWDMGTCAMPALRCNCQSMHAWFVFGISSGIPLAQAFFHQCVLQRYCSIGLVDSLSAD